MPAVNCAGGGMARRGAVAVATLPGYNGAHARSPGEFIIVPRGVEHRPVAAEEVHVLLFEPASTLNTGNVRDERTVDHPARL